MPGWGSPMETVITRVSHNKPSEPFTFNDIIMSGGLEASAYVAAPMHAGSGFIGQVYCRNLGSNPLTNAYGNVALELGGPLASNQAMFHYGLGIGKFITDASIQLELTGTRAVKLSGTAWETGSDERIKKDIVPANVARSAEVVRSVSLKEFEFDTTRAPAYGSLAGVKQLGWIAQEVSQVLPQSVTTSNAHGFSDFHSLDSDLLQKHVYGALQHALARIEALEQKVFAPTPAP